jgi:two-component system, chemotaxis family, chemotaxis protein CheY
LSNRVLVVDDEPMLCELIHDVLTSAEIEAVPISNSAQASALLREEKFDAVFLDVRMPPPDGIELARQIRASGLNQTTPIIMITGEEDRTVLTRAFQAGANFLLFKPIDRHRLLRLIRVTEGMIQREARQYQRVRVGCKVSMQLGQERSSGKTLDLSLKGAMVQAESVFSVGSVVQVELELTREKPVLHAAARVVRVVGNDCIGLHFEKMSLDDITKLQEFLLPLILTEVKVESPVSPRK